MIKLVHLVLLLLTTIMPQAATAWLAVDTNECRACVLDGSCVYCFHGGEDGVHKIAGVFPVDVDPVCVCDGDDNFDVEQCQAALESQWDCWLGNEHGEVGLALLILIPLVFCCCVCGCCFCCVRRRRRKRNNGPNNKNGEGEKASSDIVNMDREKARQVATQQATGAAPAVIAFPRRLSSPTHSSSSSSDDGDNFSRFMLPVHRDPPMARHASIPSSSVFGDEHSIFSATTIPLPQLHESSQQLPPSRNPNYRASY